MAGAQINAFRLEDRSTRWGFKVWALVFDLPGSKVNVLNQQVINDFSSLLEQLEGMGARKEIEALVFLSGKEGNFCAGADLDMISAAKTSEEITALSVTGQKLLGRWEKLPFPTIAAIDGAALGGGFEWALASSAIVASKNPAARVGSPEVMLGLIPGMGACYRLPRKVGLATALDAILTGRNFKGDRAFQAGIADACLPRENFEDSVFNWVRTNLESLNKGRRLGRAPRLGGMGGPVGQAIEKTPVGRRFILKKARAGVLSKTKGFYPAPLEALQVIQEGNVGYGICLSGELYEKNELRTAQAFGKLAMTDVSKNLRRIFEMTETVKKSNGLDADDAAKVGKYKPIERAVVLGAGVMGGGIAQLFAQHDVNVRMKDLHSGALSQGIQAAALVFKKAVKKRKLTQRQFLQKLNRIAPILDYSGFGTSEVLIEAIVEKMDIKKAVLRDVEAKVPENCIIATNTSALSVSEMQKELKHPGRFVGMHFFNPVHKMPLVEIIRGNQTMDNAVAFSYELSKQLGKIPVVVKDSPGFLVNRVLAPLLVEAFWLLEQGVPVPDIDQALVAFGMPMGPLQLVDEVGVDVGIKVADTLCASLGDRFAISELSARLSRAGKLGKKTGKGLYVYGDEAGDRSSRLFDEVVYEVLEVQPKSKVVSPAEIVERCVYLMINEAAACLDEKVVKDERELDLAMIMGIGFPPFHGGLLRYADSVGLKKIVGRLSDFRTTYGARFEPSKALMTRADNDQNFYRV